MAIHDLWSYDNAPIGTSLLGGTTDLTRVNSSSNPYQNYTGNPGMVVTAFTGPTTAVSSDGFLTFTRNSSGQDNYLTFGVPQVWANTSTQFWIGFRTKASYATTSGSTGKILCTSTSFNGALGIVIVNENDVVVAANTEAWVEVFFDTVALSFTVYVNGVVVRTSAFTSAQIANTAAFYFLFGTGGTAAPASSTRGIRDVYFLDVDSVDTMRLGPIRSKPAVLASASGSEWTLNGSPANLLTALNTALPNPPTMSPSASGPADNQPLTIGLSTSISSTTPIIAVQSQMSIQGDTANNQIDVGLVQGGITLDTGNIAVPPSTTQYNLRWPIARKAPDGGIWTPSKISATNLIATPSLIKTMMLMHLDGNLNEARGNSITSGGTTGYVSGQTGFGQALNLAPGGWLVIPSTVYTPGTLLATGVNFTIEWWTYLTGATGATTGAGFGEQTPVNQTSWWVFGPNSSNQLQLYTYRGGPNRLTSTATIPLNQWAHLALVVNAGVAYMYINGVQVASGTIVYPNGSMATYFSGYNSSGYAGYIDELRVSLYPRYSGNFTPPSSPFVSD